MDYVIKKIHLSLDKTGIPESEIDRKKEKTDVIVEMENGDLYVASFFTYSKIDQIITEHKLSGKYLSGKYFWVDLMILVEDCSMPTVVAIIEHLMEEGDFTIAFQKI